MDTHTLIHDDYVACCAFSDTTLIVASRDAIIRAYSLATMCCVRAIKATSGWTFPTSCSFSPDCAWFVTTLSGTGHVAMWDAHTYTVIRTMQGYGGGETHCSISADGLYIATGSHMVDHTDDNANLKIWDASTGERVHTLDRHAGDIIGCCFSHDSRMAVSVSKDGTIKALDLRIGQRYSIATGHAGRVTDCDFSRHDGMLVTSSTDGTIRFWNVRDGVCARVMQYNSELYTCKISPDGMCIATGTNDTHALKIWHSRTDKCIQECREHETLVQACAWSRDSRYVAIISLNKFCLVLTVPPQRLSVLVAILISRRRRLRLPAELWYWMEDQGFFV